MTGQRAATILALVAVAGCGSSNDKTTGSATKAKPPAPAKASTFIGCLKERGVEARRVDRDLIRVQKVDASGDADFANLHLQPSTREAKAFVAQLDKSTVSGRTFGRWDVVFMRTDLGEVPPAVNICSPLLRKLR